MSHRKLKIQKLIIFPQIQGSRQGDIEMKESYNSVADSQEKNLAFELSKRRNLDWTWFHIVRCTQMPKEVGTECLYQDLLVIYDFVLSIKNNLLLNHHIIFS